MRQESAWSYLRGSCRHLSASTFRCMCSQLRAPCAGEVLNCNAYDIATHAAVELAADKLIVMNAEDLQVLVV